MDFQTALNGFVAGVQQMAQEYNTRNGFRPDMLATIKATEGGKRYIRVTSTSSGQTSVHSFIDTTNGDILKGSWKAPVKNGVRGNIFKDNFGLDAVNHHGPKYLR